MSKIILKCANCGDNFEYDYVGHGRKPHYCDECRSGGLGSRSIRKEKDSTTNTIKIKCESCGNNFEFDYDGKGRKPKLCYDCKTKRKNERSLSYYNKHSEELNKKRLERFENEKNKETDEKEDIDDFKINFGSDEYKKFWNRIVSVLSELDTIRVKLCELSTDLYSYQSQCDKVDQVFLHELEDIVATGDIGKYNSQQFVLKWQASRKGRRGVKDLIEVISPIITNIPIKNVSQAYNKISLQNNYKRTYNTNKNNEQS